MQIPPDSFTENVNRFGGILVRRYAFYFLIPVLFNTINFFLFFLVIYSAFRLLPVRYAPGLLLGASLVFYGAYNIKIIILLILTVYINYRAALFLDRSNRRSTRSRTFMLVFSISWNLFFLGIFKYFNFFADGIAALNSLFGGRHDMITHIRLLLPVGISFYTFQITSYVVDVHRGSIDADNSFSKVLLFTLYFPQLVAGPIERAERLIPLLSEIRKPENHRLYSGIFMMAQGYFKKAVIADNLSPFVDLALLPGLPAPHYGYLFVGIFFALQLYADFSGYTDIARGMSRLFGIELTENFFLPFFSANPPEIWRRWHITLMSFLRDYLYFPLGGGRVNSSRKFINVMIVFGLGGLWHGAGIGFVLWGLYSGILVVLFQLLFPDGSFYHGNSRLWKNILHTFSVFITFISFAVGTLLIRTNDFSGPFVIMVHLLPETPGDLFQSPYLLTVFAIPLILMDLMVILRHKRELYDALPPVERFLWILIGTILFFAVGSFQGEQFYYFQF